MPKRAVTFLSLLLAVALAGLGWQARKATQAEARAAREARMLREDNARLRAALGAELDARRLEKTKAARTEIEREVEAIRGLKFKQPVQYASVSRAEVRAVFAKLLAEEMGEAEFEATGRAWARLGLLPRPLPLRPTLLDLLGEQVAAFFNQHEHRLYMFDDASLETSRDRVVLAHELTHALQDQYYDLKAQLEPLKNNDDRALAALAVIEGDATQVMSVFMARHISMTAVLQSASEVLSVQMEQLQKAPRFLRERMLFPYLRGQEFCAAAESIERCYAQLPASTAQILHPEKWAGQPEEPVAIEWPALEWRGQKPDCDNVAGEWGTRVLLAQSMPEAEAQRAAAGWRGDRYLAFAEGDALVWRSVWASEAEAEEFRRAEAAALAKRYVLPASEGSEWVVNGARALRLLRMGREVLLVDADSPAAADELREQFAK